MDNSAPPKPLVVTLWAMLIAAPLPGLMVYLAWINELEQYGYVLPLFLSLIALILFRWDYQFRLPSDAVAFVLITAAVGTTVLATIRESPWLSAIAFCISVTAWLRSHRSASPPHERLTYLALLLLMAIRLPLNLDLRLAASLQRVTSVVSSNLLDLFGVTHNLRGNIIELPGGTLFVEQACSGVQSLFTVLFLVCLWIVFRRRPIAAAPAYLLAGVVWAIVMNIVRITSIALSQEWYSINLSEGVPHELLGWACLAGAVLMLLSTDRLLRVIFALIPPDESGHIVNPVARLWNRVLLIGTLDESASEEDAIAEPVAPVYPLSPRLAWGLLTVVALICLPSMAFGYRVVATRFGQSIAMGQRPVLWDPAAELMKNTRYATSVTNHEALRDANSKQLGHHADVWTVVLEGLPVRIAVSQPYPEWHDMRLCYTGDGWQVNEWEPMLASPQTTNDGANEGSESEDAPGKDQLMKDWNVSYAEMIRDSGGFGTLLFCGLTRDRELLDPPMAGLYSLFDNRIKDRSSLRPNIIMLQLWTESQKPLVPEQLERVQRLFDSFRIKVYNELSGTSDAPELRRQATLGLGDHLQ